MFALGLASADSRHAGGSLETVQPPTSAGSNFQDQDTASSFQSQPQPQSSQQGYSSPSPANAYGPQPRPQSPYGAQRQEHYQHSSTYHQQPDAHYMRRDSTPASPSYIQSIPGAYPQSTAPGFNFPEPSISVQEPAVWARRRRMVSKKVRVKQPRSTHFSSPTATFAFDSKVLLHRFSSDSGACMTELNDESAPRVREEADATGLPPSSQ